MIHSREMGNDIQKRGKGLTAAYITKSILLSSAADVDLTLTDLRVGSCPTSGLFSVYYSDWIGQ